MTRKILLAVCLLALLLSLSACMVSVGGASGNDGNDGGGGADGGAENDSAIYGVGVETDVVVKSGETVNVFNVIDAITAKTGKTPDLINDGVAKSAHEIVIGNTSRDVTAKATALMERAIEDTPQNTEDYGFLVYFSVYSDGDSVALVWSDDAFSEDAVEFFLNNYVIGSYLELKKGYSEVHMFSRLEEMRKNEAAEREAAYANITEQYGEGVADALRDQYALYDERFYLWLADLYDPGKYDEDGNPLGGGFYYSNSARDNVGYLFDIESTSQALGFLVSSGMMRGYDNDYMKAIPEKMQKEMVAFALSLQSSVDGYFYHPQWGTNITAGRLSRDMGNAVSVLSKFGYKPYYNTPGGAQGSQGNPPGAAPASALTEKLSETSVVSAVSKVVPAASSIWPDRLRTLENWKAYIDAFEADMDTKSYSIGHNVAEQAAQIKNREAEAIKNGEPTGYVEYVQKFFDRHQNPENGLWEDEISYNSVNGLMKIMAIYNWLELPLNYAESAYASAVEIIKLEGKDVNGKEASNSVDVYNAWCSLVRINTNINTFGSPETVKTLRENLLRDAEEMIRITTKKTAKFIKDDGSYGYTWNFSPAKSQGAPAAVPNTVEGDVNGGTIALTAITGNMTSALGISGLYIYYPSDFEVFIKRASEHGAVEKEEIEVFPLKFDFEDEKSGETAPDGVEVSLTDGALDVSEVEGKKGSTKALRIKTVKDKGDAFTVKPLQIEQQGLNRYILEWDMKFDEIGGGFSPAMQITLGNMYMLTLKVTKDGILSFGDASTTSSSAISSTFKGSFDAYAWHNVRIEHYPLGGEPITMVFVDGELIAESRNYKESQAGAPKTPQYTEARFYCLFSTDLVAYFDNLKLDADGENYVGNPPAEEEKYLGELDFEGEELGEPNMTGLTTQPNPEDGNSIVIAKENETSENTVLKLIAKSSKTAGNWVKVRASDESVGSAYVYELDIFAETLNRTGDIAQIYLRNEKDAVIFALNMTFLKSGDGHKLLFKEKTEDSSVNGEILRVDDVISGWFTLRIEYDPATQTAKVTVNGTYSGETDAYYSEGTKTSAFGSADFYTTFATDAVILFDNISVKK